MTDQVQSAPAAEPVVAPTTSSAPAASSAPAQPVVDSVSKAKANDIAHEAHLRGVEKGRQEALAEMQLKAAGTQPYQAPTQNPQQNFGQQGVQQPTAYPAQTGAVQPQWQQAPNVQNPLGGMTPEIQQMIDARVSEQTRLLQQQELQNRQNTMWQQTLQSFGPKAQAGYGKYTDYDQALGELQLDRNQHLVHLTNLVDNTADVLMDLRNNPEKLTILKDLAYSQPQLAVKKINDISNSIKANQSAMQTQQPNAPLSQVTPSTVTTDSGSPLTVSEWRKKSYLRD